MNLKLDILEKYVDKIVLGLAGILCLAILWFFVIQTPKGEVRGQEFGPGKIDTYVEQQAQRLEETLARAPEPKQYTPKVDLFKEQFARTIDMPADAFFPLPGKGSQVVAEDRIYQIPAMPQLADAKAGNLRTVVFMPEEEVDKEHPYAQVPTKYQDIDLVTVQADLDVETIFREFQEKFNGPAVQREWRDPSLAKPVFAAVELQRQTLENGGWSEWEKVPFTKVNDYKELLEIPSDVSEIAYGGVDLLKIKLGSDDIQKAIIQPLSYEVATPANEWFPPEWQVRADEYLEQQRQEDRRAELGRERDQRRARNVQPGAMPGMLPGMMPPGMGGNQPPQRQPRANNRGRETETIEDIREDFYNAMVEDMGKLASSREPLTVWAYDDTAKPGETYRYRMRVGVFNPIAGRNWFAQAQKDLQNDVVLWTGYSEETEPVQLQPMVYIFPQEVAQARKSATMEVAKFYYGKWRLKSFDATVGQHIGEIVKLDDAQDEDRNMMAYGMSPVKEVDYSTGNTLVDVAKTTNWTSSSALRPNECDEVICSDQQGILTHLAVGRRNWPQGIQKVYGEISGLASDEFDLFQSRSQGNRRDKGQQRRQQAPQEMMPGMLPPGMLPPGM